MNQTKLQHIASTKVKQELTFTPNINLEMQVSAKAEEQQNHCRSCITLILRSRSVFYWYSKKFLPSLPHPRICWPQLMIICKLHYDGNSVRQPWIGKQYVVCCCIIANVIKLIPPNHQLRVQLYKNMCVVYLDNYMKEN